MMYFLFFRKENSYQPYQDNIKEDLTVPAEEKSKSFICLDDNGLENM